MPALLRATLDEHAVARLDEQAVGHKRRNQVFRKKPGFSERVDSWVPEGTRSRERNESLRALSVSVVDW